MLYTWPTVGLSPMRRVWLSSFLLILVWPGSCGNAEASSVGPSCTATSAAAVTVRLHEGSVPIVVAAATTAARRAPRQYALCQRCRIVNQLAARARARPEHRKTTRGETYMLQTTKEQCCLST